MRYPQAAIDYTVTNDLLTVSFGRYNHARPNWINASARTMDYRVFFLFGQNGICFANHNRRNPQLILTASGVPSTENDRLRRKFENRQQIIQSRITRLHIFLRLGSRFTLITSDTNMAIEATKIQII